MKNFAKIIDKSELCYMDGGHGYAYDGSNWHTIKLPFTVAGTWELFPDLLLWLCHVDKVSVGFADDTITLSARDGLSTYRCPANQAEHTYVPDNDTLNTFEIIKSDLAWAIGYTAGDMRDHNECQYAYLTGSMLATTNGTTMRIIKHKGNIKAIVKLADLKKAAKSMKGNILVTETMRGIRLESAGKAAYILKADRPFPKLSEVVGDRFLDPKRHEVMTGKQIKALPTENFEQGQIPYNAAVGKRYPGIHIAGKKVNAGFLRWLKTGEVDIIPGQDAILIKQVGRTQLIMAMREAA